MSARSYFNPAAQHKDPDVREAIGTLYEIANKGSPKRFGERFMARSFRDHTGHEVFLLRVRDGRGRWDTVMAVDENGTIYVGAVETGVNFDSKGWNPTEA